MTKCKCFPKKNGVYSHTFLAIVNDIVSSAMVYFYVQARCVAMHRVYKENVHSHAHKYIYIYIYVYVYIYNNVAYSRRIDLKRKIATTHIHMYNTRDNACSPAQVVSTSSQY